MSTRPFGRRLPGIVEAAGAGLYRHGTKILADSNQRVPVDTGTLRASGRVLEPEHGIDEITVIVGYGYGDVENPNTGEPASGYAIPVHERVDVHHPHGEAKFLEKAALELAPDLGGDVAVSITRAEKIGDVLQITEERIA